MIVELGHVALILAAAIASLQCGAVFWSLWSDDDAPRAVTAPAAVAQFALLLCAFGALVRAHVVSDFSVLNVWTNSHSAKPLIYKISGVWGKS